VDPPQVGDFKIVDRVLFTKMTVVQDFKKMEAMWGSGAEQPEVKKMWIEEVPHKGGEHKSPQQVGSHDNVVAGDPASHSGGRRCGLKRFLTKVENTRVLSKKALMTMS
jgi:hypothetical protein